MLLTCRRQAFQVGGASPATTRSRSFSAWRAAHPAHRSRTLLMLCLAGVKPPSERSFATDVVSCLQCRLAERAFAACMS